MESMIIDWNEKITDPIHMAMMDDDKKEDDNHPSNDFSFMCMDKQINKQQLRFIMNCLIAIFGMKNAIWFLKLNVSKKMRIKSHEIYSGRKRVNKKYEIQFPLIFASMIDTIHEKQFSSSFMKSFSMVNSSSYSIWQPISILDESNCIVYYHSIRNQQQSYVYSYQFHHLQDIASYLNLMYKLKISDQKNGSGGGRRQRDEVKYDDDDSDNEQSEYTTDKENDSNPPAFPISAFNTLCFLILNDNTSLHQLQFLLDLLSFVFIAQFINTYIHITYA